MTATTPAAPSTDAREGERLLAAAEARRRRADIEDYQAAVPLYLQAGELLGDDARVAAGLASAYSYWGGRRALNGQESDSFHELAYEEARRALELAAGLPEAHRAMAVALGRGPRFDPAARRREAELAFDGDPYDGENCYEKWRAAGRAPDDPLVYKALVLDPASPGAACDLGAALAAAGRFDEAVYSLDKALAANPVHALARYNLAMVLLRRQEPEKARAVMERAVAAHPRDPLVLLGQALVTRGGPEALFQ